jgi:hypothetical protein
MVCIVTSFSDNSSSDGESGLSRDAQGIPVRVANGGHKRRHRRYRRHRTTTARLIPVLEELVHQLRTRYQRWSQWTTRPPCLRSSQLLKTRVNRFQLWSTHQHPRSLSSVVLRIADNHCTSMLCLSKSPPASSRPKASRNITVYQMHASSWKLRCPTTLTFELNITSVVLLILWIFCVVYRFAISLRRNEDVSN